MDADTLKGKAVVSVAEAAKLGYVEDILFDVRGLQAAALQVRGSDHTFVIPFARIKHVGPDAVTVDSSQVTQAVSKGDTFSALPGLGALKKLKVVDEAGTFLGTVAGLDLDPETGRLLNLSVHKGGMLGLGGSTTTLSVGAIRGVGPEIITTEIRATAADEASGTPE